MKGIRKLFLGLFFMALFSVGFKVDAEATSLTIPSNYNWESGEDPALKGVVTVEATDTEISELTNPAEPASEGDPANYSSPVTKKIEIKQGATALSTKYLYIWKKHAYNEAVKLVYVIDNSSDAPDPQTITTTDFGTKQDVAVTVTRESAKSVFSTKEATTKKYELMLGDSSVADVDVEMFQVSPEVSGISASLVTLSDPIFLLPGETGIVSANKSPETAKADNSETVHKYKDYTSSGGLTNITEKKIGSSVEIKVEMSTTAAATSTVTLNYVSAKMNLAPNINVSAYKPGDSDSRSFTGSYNSENYAGSKVGATPISGTPWTTNTFSYTVPDLSNNTYTIAITMDDGNVFTGQVLIENEAVSLSTIKVTQGQSVPLSKFITNDGAENIYVTAKATADDYVSVSPSNVSTKASGVSVTGESVVNSATDGIVVNGTTGKVIVYRRPEIKIESSGSGSGTSSTPFTLKVTIPTSLYYNTKAWNNITQAKVKLQSGDNTEWIIPSSSSSGSGSSSPSLSFTVDWKTVTDKLNKICKDSDDTVTMTAYIVDPNKDADKDSDSDYDKTVYAQKKFTAYKISLDTNGGGTSYTVNDASYTSFYGIDGMYYKIVGKGYGVFDKNNSSSEFVNSGTFTQGSTSTQGTATISSYGVAGARTLKAAFTVTTSTTPTPTSTPSNPNKSGEGMDDYDDVPKTGESKADIWILWSVLFVSILGAGFMIWKRFGLVRAIAEADEEVAVAEHKEEVKAKKKEKEDKIKMLKDLRNL